MAPIGNGSGKIKFGPIIGRLQTITDHRRRARGHQLSGAVGKEGIFVLYCFTGATNPNTERKTWVLRGDGHPDFQVEPPRGIGGK